MSEYTVSARGARRKNAVGALLGAIALIATGCAGLPEEPLTLRASLDKATYAVGEPLVMTVRVENESGETLRLPRFDARSLTFYYGKEGTSARIRAVPVHSKQIGPAPREIPPHRRIERRFLFTGLTREPGDYAAIASTKDAVIDATLLRAEVFSPPVAYSVADRVALRRDPGTDLLLKSEALRLARDHVGGEVVEERVLLVPLQESGLVTWIVMLNVAGADGRTRSRVLCVNPYSAAVDDLELKDKEGRERRPPRE
jgi:hypothetical protein